MLGRVGRLGLAVESAKVVLLAQLTAAVELVVLVIAELVAFAVDIELVFVVGLV